jgi:phospholipid/cholesterol/gamma-HCH transport system ATP-binding protein
MPVTQQQTSVEVEDLRKSFGEQKVLNGIALRVTHGQTMVVLGRSGTGKSVLLKLLVGLQSPDSGRVRIAGKELGSMTPAELSQTRKQMGFLFQQAALYDSLTVEKNVEFPLSRHTDMSESERGKTVRELLDTVGLANEDLGKMPSEISGGMQKRVGLARALALDPAILLLDEPTAGLDPITAEEIAHLIVDLKRKREIAAVVVTHDVRGARAFADVMVLLNEGNIVAQGTFDELRKSRDEFTRRFFGGVDGHDRTVERRGR